VIHDAVLPVAQPPATLFGPSPTRLNLLLRLHFSERRKCFYFYWNSFCIGLVYTLLQEAYKAIEDIHGLMNLSKKLPVPKTMANYYQKLAMVFWKAGNYLFHAAALFKLFQLSKEMKKNITPEELQR
jgi:hypothetical protein